MKRNVSLLGLIIGLLLPLVGIFIVYLVMSRGASFGSFVGKMKTDFDAAALVLSLSILINIIPFIYYTNRRLDLTARGLLIATMLYAVLIVLLKFVW